MRARRRLAAFIGGAALMGVLIACSQGAESESNASSEYGAKGGKNCGNGICDGKETCSSCPKDCGVCGASTSSSSGSSTASSTGSTTTGVGGGSATTSTGSGTSGTTINAASASYADVSAAVSAASTGDTVQVPPGSATWSAELDISKGIVLKGSGIGATVITSSINDPYNTHLINYAPSDPAADEPFVLSGFTFDGAQKSGILQLSSNSSTIAITKLNIHHNRFTNGRSRAISMGGLEFGVVHHNEFQDNYIAISTIGSEMDGWNYPLVRGGADYPYFEDNTFTQTAPQGGFISEAGRGGRVVFRYNTITGYGGSGSEVWDAHGVTGTYPVDTGTVSAEFYNNTIGLSVFSRLLFHRGGKAIVFNNTVTGANCYMQMTEYQGWYDCTSAGYPKPQQVNGSYYWNNTVQGAQLTPDLYCPSGGCTSCSPAQYDSMFIQLNRDYWFPPAGLDANKPGSCASGSHYASTDTGKLYQCNSNGAWAVQYAPYQHPHPLAQ